MFLAVRPWLCLLWMMSGFGAQAAPQFTHPVLVVVIDAKRLSPDPDRAAQYLLREGGVPVSWSANGSTAFELESSQGDSTRVMKLNTSSIVLDRLSPHQQSRLRVRGVQPSQTEWSDAATLKIRFEPPELSPESEGSYDPLSQSYLYSVSRQAYAAPLRMEVAFADISKQPVTDRKPLFSKSEKLDLKFSSSNARLWRARFVTEDNNEISDWSPWARLPYAQAQSFRIASEGLFPKKKFRLWLSSGLTYIKYNQQSTVLASNLDFQSISPSFTNLILEAQFSKTWRAVLSYKNLEGTATGEKDVLLNSDAYSWTILDAGLQWHSSKLRPTFFDLFFRPYIHGGWQQHNFPYLEKRNSTFSIVDRKLQKVLAGGGARLGPVFEGYFDFEMNYAHLIGTDPRYQMTNNFGFEGSLSYYRKLKPWLLGGVAWYGHYDVSKFKDSGLQNVEFDETFLYSRFEFRLGAEF